MMMKGPMTRVQIDAMIDYASRGEFIPFPIRDSFRDKVLEFCEDHTSHDPESLRQEGYATLEELEKLEKEFGLTD